MKMITRHYDILDVALSIKSNCPKFLRAFDADYSMFESFYHNGDPTMLVTYEERSGAQGALLFIDDANLSLGNHPHPVACAYLATVRQLISKVKSFIVVHAAVVAEEDRAIVLCGPSGSGKTTLGLSLLREGLSYLSDDFCPIHGRTGAVHPFSRSFWISRTSEEALRCIEQTACVVSPESKIIMDPKMHDFRIAKAPCNIESLILINPDQEPTAREEMRVGLMPKGEETFISAFAGLEEAVIARRPGEFCEWQITYARKPHLVRAIVNLLQEIKPYLWYSHRVDSVSPDFSSEPLLTSISVHEAVYALMHQLKLDLASVSLGATGFRPGAHFLKLTELLKGVSCYRLSTGELDMQKKLVLSTLH